MNETNPTPQPEMPPAFRPNPPYQQEPAVPYYGRPQLGFIEAIKICFLQKYCTFKGRARRSEYWWFYLACIIANSVVSSTGMGIFFSTHSVSSYISDPGSLFLSPAYLMTIAFTLVLLLPSLAALVRRLHDTGHSGTWLWGMVLVYVLLWGCAAAGTIANSNPFLIILALICLLLLIVSTIMLLVWSCQDSERGENKYGPSPKYQ